MPSPRSVRRVALVTLVAVALTAAVVPAAGAAAPTADRSGRSGPSDRQIAEEGIVVAGDLPADWTSSTPDPAGDKAVEKAAAEIPICKRYLTARKLNKAVPNADSLEYSLGEESLNNDVWVFPSVKDAKAAFKAMGHRTNGNCLTNVYQDLVEQQVEGDPSVKGVRALIQKASNVPAVGDAAIGYAGGVNISNADGTGERILVLNLVSRVGRSIVSYAASGPATATGLTAPFSDAFDAAITTTIARLEDALA